MYQYLINKSRPLNYVTTLYSNMSTNIDLSSSKLEDLPYRDGAMDLIICINVLDHVNNYYLCMDSINRVLKTGGVLILGQDLSNEEDFNNCPESYEDVGHPIKIDQCLIEKRVTNKYDEIFKIILRRDDGRNPEAHYGTYCGILRKK